MTNQTGKATAPLKVFCSYSHRDEEALDTLRKHLSSLRLSGLIEDWHDRNIPAGGDWDAEIRSSLDAADLILLLISADFLHSEYCMQKETARALQWHHAGKATVIPVFLRECVIAGLPFEGIQGTPRDVRWINQQPFTDKAWTEVTQAVEAAGLRRLGVSRWPVKAPQEDAWSIPITDTQTPPIQPAFGGATSMGQTLPHAQSGHAYVAVDESGNTRFIRSGLIALIGLISVLALAWFIWNEWLNEELAPDTVEVETIATPENNTKLKVAKSYLEQGEYKKAQSVCQSAPESPFRKECLGITGLAFQDVSDKQVYLAEVEAVNSAFSEALLGEFYLAEFDGENNHGTLAQAEQHFAKALQQNAALASVYFGRGQIQHFTGNAEAALPLYQQALDIAPSNGRYALNRATATADAGQLKSAEKLLREVLSVNGEVLLAHAELVEVLANQSKPIEAQKEASALQVLLMQRGQQVICQPVNMAEWVVFQGGLPTFLSSWADAGTHSWSEKGMYLNYIIGLAGVPLIELPTVDCGA